MVAETPLKWHIKFFDNKSRDETYKNATSAFLKTAKVEITLISGIFSIKFYIKRLKCN
jgi:hypothetical protein